MVLKKNYLLLLTFLFTILILSFAKGQEIYRQNQQINFTHTIRLNGFPDNNIEANITILDPSSVVLVGYSPMTFNTFNKTFNFTLDGSLTSKIGTYNRCITATGSGLNKTQCFSFNVTPTGTEPSNSQGLMYFLVIILSILIFLGFLITAIKLPYSNKINEDGWITDINYYKHVKIAAAFMSYLMLMWIFWLAYNLSAGFLFIDIGTRIFYVLFVIMLVSFLPIFLTMAYLSLFSFLRDKKIRKAIERGLPFR